MSILVIAEHDNQTIRPATRSAIGAARELGDTIDLLIIGHALETVTAHARRVAGIHKIWVVDDVRAKDNLAEVVAPTVKSIAENYAVVITAATSSGKNLLPRVAALLDVDMVSEVTAIIDASTYVRPLYAGNLNATVQNTASKKLLTIRPTAFDAVMDKDTLSDVTAVPLIDTASTSTFVSREIQVNDRPELATARVVVSGGRSLGSAERFNALLSPLALKLNAAVGATRAAVDAGFAPNEYQVGQTGTVIAPELYIAVGVSGATQHIAGIKDSRVIVAINHDPDAQIFEWADYGLVADLFTSVTELERALN